MSRYCKVSASACNMNCGICCIREGTVLGSLGGSLWPPTTYQNQEKELSPSPSSASEILLHASKLVSDDRAEQHGPKERNHQNIADHWNAYLGGRVQPPISALDVALMMVELKIARTKLGAGQTNRDNYVDMAGYAGVAGEIALSGKEEK